MSPPLIQPDTGVSSSNPVLLVLGLVMSFAWPLVLTLLGAFYIFSGFITLLVRQHRSPLRDLRGPTPKSFFMGNLMEMHDQENDSVGDGPDPTLRPLVARWEAAHGSTFVYRGFIGGCRLMTTDPLAIAHILGNAYRYPKPDFVRDSLATMAAGHEGMLTVEGDQHRRQRKILNPAFTSSHIKSLTPIFWRTAEQLRNIWVDQSVEHQQNPMALATSSETTPLLVDALSWLGRATLDVIGHAGFGYTFNALAAASAPSSMGNLSPDDSTKYTSSPSTASDTEKAESTPGIKESELSAAFGVIFSTARKFRVMTILQVWFPVLRRLRRNNAMMIKAQATMRRIGLDLIAERSAKVVTEATEKKDMPIEGDKTMLGRDILSVLIRSNHAAQPNQRMSIEEVLCQISTFIAAGHETTASALTWTMYALAKDVEVQRKLREELRSYDSSRTPFDQLSSEEQGSLEGFVQGCQYLDWVVRESLRVHAPITNTMRVVLHDDEIPVMKPFEDRHGNMCSGIRVKKHDIISIPLQGINKSTDLWGEDAGVFRPERWESPPESTRAIPGLYSNLLTFLNGNPVDGNRSCIGYKFSLIEIKVFLFVLCRDFEFTMDPATIIEKKINVVTRPFVKSEPALGNQMPIRIRALDLDGETRVA